MGGYSGSPECCSHTRPVSGDCHYLPSFPTPNPAIAPPLPHTCISQSEIPPYLHANIAGLQRCSQSHSDYGVGAANDGVLQLAEGQDVYQLLGSPYQDLWLHWLDEGNEAYKQQAKNSNQERLDFVRSVVAAAASSAVASQNGSTEPKDNAASANTTALPKVSIRARPKRAW